MQTSFQENQSCSLSPFHFLFFVSHPYSENIRYKSDGWVTSRTVIFPAFTFAPYESLIYLRNRPGKYYFFSLELILTLCSKKSGLSTMSTNCQTYRHLIFKLSESAVRSSEPISLISSSFRDNTKESPNCFWSISLNSVVACKLKSIRYGLRVHV